MLRAIAFVGSALVVLTGCGAGAPTSSPEPSAAVTTGCEVRAGGGAGPVSDSGGPFFHQVVVASAPDGARVADPVTVLEHASVPDAVRLPDGRVLVYYVNGQDGGVWVARLDDRRASVLAPITVDGVLAPAGIVDPDATLLPDGRVRLVYLSGFGAPGSGAARAFCLAESTDGLSFRVTGRALALTDEQSTDPSLLRLGDGSWLLAWSRGRESVLARSADGASFQPYATLGLGGVPELADAGEGAIRLYACANGIVSAVSRDGGRTFAAEGTVVAPGILGKRTVCDPSYVAGAGLFVFKTAD